MASAEQALKRIGGAAAVPARALVYQVAASLGAFERMALGYFAVSGAMMIVCHQNLPNAALHLSVHAVVALVIVAISIAPGILRRGEAFPRIVSAAEWIRDWFPQAVFLFCFEELRILVHLIQPAWRDAALIRFDRWLTGVDPTVWFAGIASPALNEGMQAAYLTYFFYLTILATSLYRETSAGTAHREGIRANAARRAYWSVMTGSMAAYAIGYVISIFFPIESPYYSMAALRLPELHGGPATALINLIERFGRVHGGAFPSAHVSGSFVALLGAWKYRRWMFWIFLPLFIAMCVATVYGRYHYVADVAAGIVMGAIGVYAGEALT